MKESQRSRSIIPFTEDHIPEVNEMFCRLMLADESTRRLQPKSVLDKYFREIFFHNPWYDESIPSWVYKGSNGRIVGFIGVVPRKMKYHGESLQTAVSFHFMVSPESRSSLAGIRLLERFFSGPQDLSMTDGAGEIGRRVWEGVGGQTAGLYSLFWTKILRPGLYAYELVCKGTCQKPVAGVAKRVAIVADLAAAALAPDIYEPEVDVSKEEDLDLDALIEYMPLFAQTRSLLPVYETDSLHWLFRQLEQMNYYGSLQKVLIRGNSGEVLGWFIYYLKPGGVSTAIHLLARKRDVSEVLNHLFSHARRNKSIAVHCRLNPKIMQELSDKRCFFNRNGPWTLIHSRNRELLCSIQSGDAFLSRLEGEFGLLF